MHSYLCNTSWSTQRLLLLDMRSNSKWYYIWSGVIETQRQGVGLWIYIQKEEYHWFTKCYEPLKVWFLLHKKTDAPIFFLYYSLLTDSESFKSKIRITRNTPGDGNTKDVEIPVPLKYVGNFWRTLELSLINCEINLILT